MNRFPRAEPDHVYPAPLRREVHGKITAEYFKQALGCGHEIVPLIKMVGAVAGNPDDVPGIRAEPLLDLPGIIDQGPGAVFDCLEQRLLFIFVDGPGKQGDAGVGDEKYRRCSCRPRSASSRRTVSFSKGNIGLNKDWFPVGHARANA